MIIFDDLTGAKTIAHNLNWPYIPDHTYILLIIRSSGSGKTNKLLNLINHQPGIYKIYIFAKVSFEAKHQFLFNKRESVSLKHSNDPKAKIEYSDNMQDVYENAFII